MYIHIFKTKTPLSVISSFTHDYNSRNNVVQKNVLNLEFLGFPNMREGVAVYQISHILESIIWWGLSWPLDLFSTIAREYSESNAWNDKETARAESSVNKRDENERIKQIPNRICLFSIQTRSTMELKVSPGIIVLVTVQLYLVAIAQGVSNFLD